MAAIHFQKPINKNFHIQYLRRQQKAGIMAWKSKIIKISFVEKQSHDHSQKIQCTFFG